jgi:hypothetical protein
VTRPTQLASLFSNWAVPHPPPCDMDRPPRDPSDPGTHRPPPNREWGWFLLAAAVVTVMVYAALYSHAR